MTKGESVAALLHSVARLETQLLDARATNTRLHRRCQKAEAALKEVDFVGLAKKRVSGNLSGKLLSYYVVRREEEIRELVGAIHGAMEHIVITSALEPPWLVRLRSALELFEEADG